jgi:predicted DNA-binding transcriptional regulator YafY
MRKKRPDRYESAKRTLAIMNMMGVIPITTKQIHNRLLDLGFDISERTVLRDMETLPEIFPQHVYVIDRMKPYGYKLPKGNRKLLGMSPEEAICLELAKDYLGPLLPPGALDPIASYFKEAGIILQQMQTDIRMKNWRNKVLIINEGFNLEPAKIKKGILEEIQTALWQGKVIKIAYTSKNKSSPSEYLIHPCGLVYRGRISYLVCSFDNNTEKFIYLPLQRFSNIEIQNETSVHQDVDIKTVAKDLIGYNKSPNRIKIKLRFSSFAGSHLQETPISLNQKISITKDGFFNVEDEVNDDMELRFWIRAFGDEVEVIKPKKLREEFRKMAKRMEKKYEAD